MSLENRATAGRMWNKWSREELNFHRRAPKGEVLCQLSYSPVEQINRSRPVTELRLRGLRADPEPAEHRVQPGLLVVSPKRDDVARGCLR